MPDKTPARRRTVIIVVLLLLLALLALLLVRCSSCSPVPAKAPRPAEPVQAPPAVEQPAAPTAARTALPSPDDVLAPATVQAPVRVLAGATFSVQWTGPNNPEDYVTIVPKAALETAYTSYCRTNTGATLKLTAPIEPGDCEVRYVAGRARKVLGRAPITVEPAAATLEAPAEAVMGTEISVAWTGPNNAGDYVTIVAKDVPDGRHGNYSYVAKGSPIAVLVPIDPGEDELRYMTGQGDKVLARRAVRIVAAEVTLAAADEAVAGSTLSISWTGPNNHSDYITIVARTRPDGQYGNYSYVAKGSPLAVLVPIDPGEDELRYMTGQGDKVLARRALRVVAARITLAPPAEAEAGSPVLVLWTGPDYPGDYITIVEKSKPDGQYGNFVNSRQGSPAKILAPKETGEAEVRYMSGQDGKVLARHPITIVPNR
jgi:Ca-activated chloride channel family protein